VLTLRKAALFKAPVKIKSTTKRVQFKENKVDSECIKHWRYNISVENLKGRDHLKDLEVGGSIK
jgi:hypothetical protein